MEEKKRYKVYKIIMLAVIVAFVTFMITSIGMYQLLSDRGANKAGILMKSSSSDAALTTTLNRYRNII